MKDRTPTYPGRVKLTPVSGQANTYDMVRADQPTQEGTPLNKDTLLKDTTATALGLTGDPTVDEAFAKLAKKSEYKIGDIKLTANSDPGDGWLLCNGITVSAADYPEYCKKFGYDFSINKIESSLLWSYQVLCATYANGYLVVGGTYKDGSYSLPRCWYTSDGGTTWAYTTFGETSVYNGYNTNRINRIKYINNTWVACVSQGQTQGVCSIWYSTGTPADTWQQSTIRSTTPYVESGANDIIYRNGKWIACLSTYDSGSPSGQIATASSLTPGAGSWSSTAVFGASSLATSIIYANGYYVVGGSDSISPCIAYSTNLTTWTKIHLGSGSGNYPVNTVHDLVYANGSCLAVGQYYNSDGYHVMAWTSQSITSGWASQDLYYFGNSNVGAFAADYLFGYWLVGGTYYDGSGVYHASIWMATSPTGPWTRRDDLWDSGTSGYVSRVLGFASTGAEAIAVGAVDLGNASSSSGTNGRVAYMSINKSSAKIPTVSIDGAYAYIKVKEETT